MSDDSPADSNTPADAEAASPVRPRRTVPPRAKKAAPAKKAAATAEKPAPPPAVEKEAAPVQPATVGEWPENDSAPPPPGEPGKRKRRRRKGKGSSGAAPIAGAEETHPLVTDQAPPEALPGQTPRRNEEPRPAPEPRPASPAPPRHRKADPDLLAKKAWKIFLSEVSEEGVALIGDHDAKELSRRCFRLAEIFLDEQARRAAGQ